ncbi:small multidrug efflux protein [Ruania zhangjianzhongii]|uniref:small multidrug efflux protein n=1 Tax=Ruania zhangjianzhongii TaxID=2603206 RepID=UPI001F2AC6F1|nr:small multidrug efflux protein [Ruania zhangjianzhongii]
MNPIADLIQNFQELMAQVPEFLQPFIVLLGGMIPFIEGDAGGVIGVLGGINPFVAGAAAAAGNLIAVSAVVYLSSRARTAVVASRSGGVQTLEEPKPESKGRQRVQRWLVRFGVPGASLLAPVAIPSHFTAALFVASGAPRRWVLLWQAVAIVAWTALTTTLIWVGLNTVLM